MREKIRVQNLVEFYLAAWDLHIHGAFVLACLSITRNSFADTYFFL